MRISILVTILSAIPYALAGQDAWHMDVLGTLVRERLDPIVSPNREASHMHRIAGGSAFAASYDYETQMKSTCTSSGLTIDKSNYWMPQMYWVNSSTSFYPLTSVNRFYYFLQRDDPSVPVEPFPKGLRILQGDPNAKTASGWNTFQCQRSTTDQYYGSNFNFDTPCAQGIKIEVRFPSCWDGVNLYKADGSHMTWPSIAPGFGNCPMSHPRRLPLILLEYTWQVPSFARGINTKGHLAWANGDTTGFGVHADFQNGWDYDILKAALQDPACVNLGKSIPIINCPTFAPYVNIAAAKACTKPDRGSAIEPVGVEDWKSISALPGCNKLWGETGAKPTCSPSVPELDVSALTGVDGPLLADAYGQGGGFPMPTNVTDWTRVGCFFSNSNPTLVNTTSFYDDRMTPQRCTAACAESGKSFAAMQKRGPGPWVCLCGSSLSPFAASMPSKCTARCPGDASKTCGGEYFWETFQGPKIAAPKGGCYTLAATRSLPDFGNSATYSFTSTKMTRTVCSEACQERGSAWAGVQNGNKCLCGNGYPIGAGDWSESCGTYTSISVMPLALGANTTQPDQKQTTGRLGCFSDSVGTRVLTGSSFKHATAMTPSYCAKGCSEMRFKLSGVRAGDTCYCGNDTLSAQILPNSQCGTKCTGNQTLTCGSGNNIEVYNTSLATPAQQTISNSDGLQGCYTDSGNDRTLGAYSFTSNSMTTALCRTGCAQMNYTLAGTELGRQCWCGNALGGSARPQPYSVCTSPCSGNSSQTCGGDYKIQVYSTNGLQVPTQPAGSLGCYDTANPSTKAPGLVAYSYYSDKMDSNLCKKTCQAQGYSKAALNFGNKCSCGNAWTGGRQIAPVLCDKTCAGNSTESCGSGSASSLFDTTGAGISTSDNATAGSGGCFSDPNTMKAYSYSASIMSPGLCAQQCKTMKYSISGVQNGNTCLCGTSMPKALLPATSCSMACTNVPGETCGGRDAVSVSLVDPFVARLASTGQLLGDKPGDRGYIGCYQEYSSKLLTGWSHSSSAMTTETCLTLCKAQDFAYAGTTNARTCYCGNDKSVAVPGTLRVNSECSSPCPGKTSEMCGGGYRWSMYDVKAANPSSSATAALKVSASTAQAQGSKTGTASAPSSTLSVSTARSQSISALRSTVASSSTLVSAPLTTSTRASSAMGTTGTSIATGTTRMSSATDRASSAKSSTTNSASLAVQNAIAQNDMACNPTLANDVRMVTVYRTATATATATTTVTVTAQVGSSIIPSKLDRFVKVLRSYQR